MLQGIVQHEDTNPMWNKNHWKNGINISNEYSIKFHENELIDLINDEISISKDNITKIIDLFIFNPDSYDDLATKFFIRNNGYIYPLFTNFKPQPNFITEYWLSCGGVKFSERGNKFEKYFKDELHVRSKKFDISICKENILFHKKKEEIDCALIFGKTLYLLEIKCLKIPFDTNVLGNAEQNIRKGIKQIIRKTQYVSDNQSLFMKKYFPDHKINNIQPILITNIFDFTGLSINGVPITDASSIFTFFENNSLHYIGDTSKRKPKYKYLRKFYETIQSAHLHFLEYIKNPPQQIFFKDGIEKEICDHKIAYYEYRDIKYRYKGDSHAYL